MSGYWAYESDKVLSELFKTFTPETPLKEVEKAICDAYPFGERKYWPYRVWLTRVKLHKKAFALGLKTADAKRTKSKDTETLNLF